MYDYLIAGAGLFGAVFAREMTDCGKKCLVIDKRSHIGGNTWCENISGINVHRYGAHIFHTSNEKVWRYVNRFADFNNYTHKVIAKYRDSIYSLPFNMNTFRQLWGVETPQEAKAIIAKQIAGLNISEPKNLEEQALVMAGTDIYEKLIKGYTEKQWDKPCSELPPFIIKRLPLRFDDNDNYFNDNRQGIPAGGYNPMVKNMLKGIDVRLETDYFEFIRDNPHIAEKTVFTGQVDKFFSYRFGTLEYRSLRFETTAINTDNYQNCAVVNYTGREVPYTRIIEHKHFEPGTQSQTVITHEYPAMYKPGIEPFYPVNDEKNTALHKQYRRLADTRPDVIFGGRLGSYRYYDMDEVINEALEAASAEKALTR